MLEGFASLVGVISNVMYSYLLIIMLLAVGLYFTLRSRFVQLRLLPESIRVVGEKTDSNSVSAFQALMVSTASRVGTGNIVGVANAIAIGGYGAVFWMWLIAIVGGASAFIESTLAQIYKKRDASGGSYGGPSYYIEAALKNRALGVIFAIALIATYAGGFNMLASFNLIDSMSNYGFYHQFMMGDKSLVPMIGGRHSGDSGRHLYHGRRKTDCPHYRCAGSVYGRFLHPDGSCGHVLKHRKTTGSVCQYFLQCL